MKIEKIFLPMINFFRKGLNIMKQTTVNSFSNQEIIKLIKKIEPTFKVTKDVDIIHEALYQLLDKECYTQGCAIEDIIENK